MGMGPTQSVLRVSWGFNVKRPNLSTGGLRSLRPADALHQFDPPPASAACRALLLGDALDPGASDLKTVAARLRRRRG